MALSIILLLLAIWKGLEAMGWGLPLTPGGPHGALMVGGFFGALISLERAFAMGRNWTYIAPLLAGVGGVALALGLDEGSYLLALGSLLFVAMFVAILSFKPNLSTATMGLGALFLLVGNLVWLWEGVKLATPYWGAFLLLTIAGERLELAQLLRAPGRARHTFALAIAIYLAGVVTSSLAYEAGLRLLGLGMVALFVWLLIHDVAMQGVEKEAMVRYIAVCLVLGYIWLGVSGILALAYGGTFAYDAMLHSLMLGFVFSMVFGHGPVVFPALLEVNMPYLRSYYLPLGLLHISLLLRLAANLGFDFIYRWSGILSAIAILLFFINNGIAIQKGKE